ncbi:MAG: hydrogenase maturation protease [Coriobacteriia bacterium]|nr:hydrogenase maturation protease [Coriobacteriia bacterium]
MAPRTDREAGGDRPPAAVAVVCLGNTLMCDDGVAAAVARLLGSRLPREAALHVQAHADQTLVSILRGSSAVVVVDALDAGAPPGAVFRFDPDEAGVTRTRSHNMHGMGLGYALTNARLLGADPRVVVFGVQVGDVRPAPDTLSPRVASAVPDVAELVAAEVRSMLAQAS